MQCLETSDVLNVFLSIIIGARSTEHDGVQHKFAIDYNAVSIEQINRMLDVYTLWIYLHSDSEGFVNWVKLTNDI